MTRSIRSLTVLVFAVAALAAIPAGASAITITSPAEGSFTNTTDLAVEFNDPGALMTATCELDAVPVVCSTAQALLVAVTEGAHTFTVNGMTNSMMCMMWDPVNTSMCISWVPMPMPAIPATVNFTVDRTAPLVSITSGPGEAATVSGTSATFGLSANEGTVSCKLDGVAVACAGTAELTGLTPGSHQLVVTSTDQAGNVGSATRNFVVTAASAATIISAPKSVKIGSTIKIKLSCPDGCTLTASLNGKSGGYKVVKTLAAGTTSYSYKLNSTQRKAAQKRLTAKKPKAYIEFKIVGGSGSKKVKLLPKAKKK